MFYSIKKAELINYADDNTVTTVQPTQKLVVDLLQAESRVAIAWFTLNQMLANPEKFQAIFINCVENDIEIKIDGIKLSSEDHVKLLGVNLDSKLNFEIHIQQICFKAGNHLNVLKRLSPFINCKDRMAIFRSFILYHLEFCSVVWHFCGKTSIRRMEKHRREPYALCTEIMTQHTMISYTRPNCRPWNWAGRGALLFSLTKFSMIKHQTT